MRTRRYLFIALFVVILLACDLNSGLQTVQTQIPAFLTRSPSELEPLRTLFATLGSHDGTPVPTLDCSNAPSAGGLNIRMDNVRQVLDMTGQIILTDGNENGTAVTTARLTSMAASTFSLIADGFTAEFIGNPCNLTEIRTTIPRMEGQKTVDQGVEMVSLLFTGVLPPDVSLGLIPWAYQNYGNIPLGGQQQTTLGIYQFTLKREENKMILDVTPGG
jgi:hypothetical protein